MKTAAKKRYGFMAVLLCILILMSAIVPVMSVLKDYQVYAAEGDITIYFDTSCTGKSGTGSKWKKVPGSGDKIYCYTFKSASSSGFVEMTAVPGKVGSDGGRLYKCTVNRNDYSYLVISCENSWNNKINYTMDFQLSNVSENDILMLNSNGVDVGGGEYVQGMYVMGKYQVPIDYHNESVNTFSILNMDDTAVTLWIQYSTRTKNLEKDEWNPDVGDDQKNPAEYVTILARNYEVNQFQVPVKKEGCEPWQTVTIYADNSGSKGQEIKKYYLPEGKILGRSFFYGVTDFQDQTSPLSYGSKLCYQTKNLSSVGSTNYELYFDKGFFPESTAYRPAYGSPSINAEAISKDGNAKFKTADNVTISPHDNIITPSPTTVDLSASIMSVTYKGVQYNLFAPQTADDNLITVNDNVAVISGKYTVQSTNNVLTEGTKSYNYITTQADFYDYQYDHNTGSEYYNYNYTDVKQFIYFKNNWKNNSKWNKTIRASFWGNGLTQQWPGSSMTWVKDDASDGFPIFRIELPSNAQYVIFNGGDNTAQTVTITLSDRGGDNCYYQNGGNDTAATVGHFLYIDDKAVVSNRSYPSERGNAKRPYVAINEFLSQSSYAQNSTNYPMYLGQFWLPLTTQFGGSFANSSGAYTADTAAKQRAGHNGDSDAYFYDTNHDGGYYRYFGFGNYLENFNWKANLAYRYHDQAAGTYEPYNAVVQGLVKNQLGKKGTPNEGKLLANDGANPIPIPYFDTSWWRGQFTTSQGNTADMSDYMKPYENYAFPFFETAAEDVKFKLDVENKIGRIDVGGKNISRMMSDDSRPYEGTYYVFDSSKNAIHVNESEKKLDISYNDPNKLVKDNYGDGKDTNEEVGLFPFNTKSDGGHDSKKLHYGFGIKFSVDFFLTEKGTLDDTDSGIPITFTFQGDDDVWVFLDDELILDMGGAHKNAIGEINFKDKKVYVGAADTINPTNANEIATTETTKPGKYEAYFDTQEETNSHKKLSNSSNIQNSLTPGKHKITMFYLERGMLNSNLYVMFNLPLSLTRFDLQNDTDFSGVNKGFENATKCVAENDVFNYSVQNRGTANVVGSDYLTPTTTSQKRSNAESGTTLTTTLSNAGSGSQHTYNFKGSASGSYVPMISNDSGTGVTYQLTEPDFAEGAVVTYDTRTVDENKGIVSMQYGEMATFSKQVTYGTSMKVKQLDTLSAPSGGSRASDYVDNTQRKASDYYITHYQEDKDAGTKYRRYAGIYRGDDVADKSLQHVDSMYSGVASDNPKNYSTNHVINPQVDNGALQFVFADPQEAGSSYVFLRQVVVNEIKTTDLRITKDIFAGESSTGTFDFKIYFSNVFGKTDGDGKIDYSHISYTKHSGSTSTTYNLAGSSTAEYGEFSLNKGEYIEIKDIPVMTKYYIEEVPPKGDHKLSSVYSVNLGSNSDKIQLKNSSTAIAMNKRDTGNIDLQKLVYDDTGAPVDGSGITAEFKVLLALFPYSEVDLSKYPIKFKQNGVNLVDADKVKDVTATMQSSDPTIYTSGCKVFEITIKANSAKNATALRLNVENIPYNTRYNVLERTEDVPAGYIIPGTMPGGSVWTESDYNCNSSGTYSNVIFKDSTKTVDNTDNDLITVENMINPIVMPTTGGSGVIFIFPLGILAIVLSGAAVMIYKRKMDNGYIFGKGRYMK